MSLWRARFTLPVTRAVLAFMRLSVQAMVPSPDGETVAGVGDATNLGIENSAAEDKREVSETNYSTANVQCQCAAP